MLVLIGIAFAAGVITAISPCVFPVLPIIFAGGASGGRRRPYAIIAGSHYLLFDLGFAVGAMALAAILVQATVKHIVMLYREEALP